MLDPQLPEDLARRQARQACAQLNRCLRASEPCSAEELFTAFPAAALDEDAALEVIYTEFVIREELGQRPVVAEWYARFPQWRKHLQQLFEVHRSVSVASDQRGDKGATLGPSGEDANRKEEGSGLLAGPRCLGQYELFGEIARGGMGAILKGRDPDLGRDIAVKVLLETHRGKTELVQRFVEEAQIGGQLQHPGVVPVYEIGQFSDQRPYFTMKLVKGQTLAALLAVRKDVTDDRTKFVGIFAQVCQTLAYAHARGVIHRDLKPSNVMVGAFGEVQVMDWGLAKVLNEGGVADEKKAKVRQTVSVIQTQRSAGLGTPEVHSPTQLGSVLGTPAYMAPGTSRR